MVTGRAELDPFRSRLGAVTVALPGEPWPTYEGVPMIGLAQLNLAEVPFVSEPLRDQAFISVFIAEQDDYLVLPDDRPNGDGWLVRAYESGSGLVPVVDPPRTPEWLRPHSLAWEAIDDMPDWDDLSEMVDLDAIEPWLGGREVEDVLGSPADGTKLGGWPSLIQSQIQWHDHPAQPSYCFQIDSDEHVGLNLWDRGVLHIGRGAVDGGTVWIAETQFM